MYLCTRLTKQVKQHKKRRHVHRHIELTAVSLEITKQQKKSKVNQVFTS